MKKAIFCSMVTVAAAIAHSAGFGIYEASSRGNAVGGALVGDANDATANYYNPANIAFSTNIQFAVGLTMINPYCDVDVDHKSQDRMNPGWFAVPTAYLTVPLPKGFALGWGNYTEFGLGTRYGGGWDLAADTQKTTMRQVTLNPNVAYRVLDNLAVSAGLRASWIQFANHKEPNHGENFYMPGVGYVPTMTDAYHLRSKLKGDDWGVGWNAAIDWKATSDLSLGLVYRSQIRHKIKGNFDLKGNAGPVGMNRHLPASARLRLPRSITAGANYKVTPRYRVGAAVTWTEWSSVDTINFRIPEYGYRLPLRWRDTWRVGIGMEYDLLDWLTLRCGYTFDEDPTSKSHSTTMLPRGDRHIIGTGLGFKLCENLYLDFGYSFIRMNNTHNYVEYKRPDNSVGRKYFSAHNGFSHLVSVGLRYSF